MFVLVPFQIWRLLNPCQQVLLLAMSSESVAMPLDHLEKTACNNLLELVLFLMKEYQVADWTKWRHRPDTVILDRMHKAYDQLVPKLVRVIELLVSGHSALISLRCSCYNTIWT